jgi:hypothetical protein
MQIAQYEIKIRQSYPTVYTPEQVQEAQAACRQSLQFSAATSVFDLGGALYAPLGWVSVGIGYAQVGIDALKELAKNNRNSKSQQRGLFESTPSRIDGNDGGSIISSGRSGLPGNPKFPTSGSPRGPEPHGASGGGVDVWAIVRTAITQYYAEGGK